MIRPKKHLNTLKSFDKLFDETYIKIIFRSLYFIITVLILSSIAFYNKFPLVYSDSGTYLDTSISLYPPIDRVFGYSLFIRIVTWQATTWTIILFQNLIISYIIFIFLKLFIKNRQLYLIHFISINVLLLCSSLCWISCQIMPDIFIPAIVLVLMVFLLQEKLNRKNYFIYSLLIVLFLISHLANILLFFPVLMSIGIIFLIKRPHHDILIIIKRRFYVLLITGIISVLFIMIYNFAYTKSFKLSTSSNVFLTAKFNDTGLLKQFLDDNCISNNEYVLCKYKDSLPESSNGFLWGSRSPLHGYKEPDEIVEHWLYADSAYAPIVKGILLTPAYYPKLVNDAVKYTWYQLISFKTTAGEVALGKNSAPYYPYRDHYKNELKPFLHSLQNTGELRSGTFQKISHITVFLSLIIILTGLFFVKQNFTIKSSTIIIALSILLNAFISANFSVVEDRYQSRIIWLIPLLAIVYSVLIIKNIRETEKKMK